MKKQELHIGREIPTLGCCYRTSKFLPNNFWCRFSSFRLTFTHFRFISYSMTFWDRAKTERCVNKALWCVARGGAPKLPILYWMLSSQYTYNYNNRKSSHFWAIKIYWQLNTWQWQCKWWIINIANSGLYCSGSTQPLWLYVLESNLWRTLGLLHQSTKMRPNELYC